MPWVIKFDGEVFREADLTIDEAERMEVATSTTWRSINPVRSARHARAILETLLVTRTGVAPDVAAAKVGEMKVSDYLDMITHEEEDADLPTTFADGFPPGADASTTST